MLCSCVIYQTELYLPTHCLSLLCSVSDSEHLMPLSSRLDKTPETVRPALTSLITQIMARIPDVYLLSDVDNLPIKPQPMINENLHHHIWLATGKQANVKMIRNRIELPVLDA